MSRGKPRQLDQGIDIAAIPPLKLIYGNSGWLIALSHELCGDRGKENFLLTGKSS